MDWRDLIIYEMHIRDMTEHPSSGVKQRGTYKGLTEKGNAGGLEGAEEAAQKGPVVADRWLMYPSSA